MTLTERIDQTSAEDIKREMKVFIARFTNPAFGSLPKREIELSVYEMLRSLSIIPDTATVYDMMTDLRITRSKASQLLFDLEVRRYGSDKNRLDAAIRQALENTRFVKDGDYFVLEIENPLTLAHFRQKIKDLHFISDTSFNSSLVRVSLDAATALIIDLIPPDQHQTIKNALVAAGAPDSSIKGVIKSSLKKLGAKVLGEAADQLTEGVVDGASQWIAPLFAGAADVITGQWLGLLGNQNVVPEIPDAQAGPNA